MNNSPVITTHNPTALTLNIPVDILTMYGIGTSNTQQPIFWQLNPDWSIVNARYQSRTLYNQPQGIFGLHLLNLVGDNTAVYFMRSEHECLNMSRLVPNNRSYRCLYMFIPEQNALECLTPHFNVLKRCKVINFNDAITFNIPLKVIQSVNKRLDLSGPFTDEPEPMQPDFTMLNYPVKCRNFQEFRQLFTDMTNKYAGIMQALECEYMDVVTLPC